MTHRPELAEVRIVLLHVVLVVLMGAVIVGTVLGLFAWFGL